MRTDVARFYHSIYSHSIAWAIHGKAAAKANKTMALAGNRLDRALRNSRDGQTVGIPIGPDTSLVVAELILSRVDADLQTNPSMRAGFRYIDDYELSAETEGNAADLVAAIQELLSHYELELNPIKTSVLPLPISMESPWASELRALPLTSGDRSERRDLIRLFDRAFDHVRVTPSEPILRYLMGRLKATNVLAQNWKLYQELVLQSITVEPGCLASGGANILRHTNAGFPIDRDLWQDSLNRLIVFHAPLRHDNEVAWALWLTLALGLRVEARTAEILASSDDSVVVLLALHAEDANVCDAPFDKSYWESLMVPESLSDKNWLLAYEATERGWLPTVGGADFVGADTDFRVLRNFGVRFYDVAGIAGLHPTGVSPSFGLAPMFAFY